MANHVSVPDKKNQFFIPLKDCHQNLITRQPTNFGMKSQSFVVTTHVIAEQFKQSGV
jgi:hypothetical protein